MQPPRFASYFEAQNNGCTDGASASAPLLGTFTGDAQPPMLSAHRLPRYFLCAPFLTAFARGCLRPGSTGRDMYIAFDTDHGNYGLTTAGTHEDPGFYADWHFAAHLENAGICASDWEGAALNCPPRSKTAASSRLVLGACW